MPRVSRLAILLASCMTTSLLSATAFASLSEATSFSSSATDWCKTAPRISSLVQEASSLSSKGYLPDRQGCVTDPLDRFDDKVLEAKTAGFPLCLDVTAESFELLIGCPQFVDEGLDLGLIGAIGRVHFQVRRLRSRGTYHFHEGISDAFQRSIL